MIFHHIGIFVADIEQGYEKLARTLPITSREATIEDAGLKVKVAFCYDSSGMRYELVAPFGEGNPVSGVLASGKAILNHMAYTVPNLSAAAQTLRKEGAIPLGPARPALAFGGQAVMFFLTPLRFIIELIEAPHNKTL